jgi:hypothetical protein
MDFFKFLFNQGRGVKGNFGEYSTAAAEYSPKKPGFENSDWDCFGEIFCRQKLMLSQESHFGDG